MSDSIIAAAVQMDARVGDVSGNLARAERLAREAFSKGARWVMLPEFFTSPVAYHESLLGVALPPDGPAARMMCDLAREYSGFVGGSFIAADGGDAFNRYMLAGPKGILGTHDKDQPTMWENAYYVGGKDDGLIETPIGTVGAAVCWELVRTRTVKRLRGKVRLIAAGSAWWSVPQWRLARAVTRSLDENNREMMRAAPGEFARLVGAPVIHAAHCGRFACDTPYLSFLPFPSYYLGEAQITSADGAILARRTFEEREGVITAELKLDRREPEQCPERFWIPNMPRWMRAAWSYQNRHGEREYSRLKNSRAFNWQQPGWQNRA